MGRRISPDLRAQAEVMYVFEERKLTTISKLLGISRNTLATWRTKDAWESRRRSRAVSGPELAARLQENISLTLDKANSEGRVLTAGEIDGMSKLTKVIDGLDGVKHFNSNAIKTMDLFSQHIGRIDKDLKTQLAPVIIEFIRDLTAE